MSVRLTRIAERARERQDRDRAALGAARAAPLCAEARLGCMFIAGDRVFDRVTGQEGIVVASTRENVVVPAPER